MKTTRFTLLWLAFLFISFSGFAQNTEFQKSFGGSGSENSYSIKRTLDGGYITVGYTNSYGSGQKDVYLVKTDGMGKIQWQKAYGGSKDDIGWKVAIASDSGFVVVGTSNSYNNNNEDALVFKTDKSGNVSWTRTFASDSMEDGYNVIRSLFSNGYYVIGYVKNDSTGNDAFLAKLGSAGNVRWYKKFGSPGNEEAYSVTEDAKGNVLVCGITSYDSITNGGTSGSSGTTDGFLAKFDSLGNYKWMRTYGTAESDVLWDVKTDKNDYLMVGWMKTDIGDDEIIYLRTDTAGSVTSSASFGTVGDDRAFNIQVNQGGRYSIVGYTDPTGSDRDVVHLSINNAGSLQNYSVIGGGSKDGHWPTDITTARDGGFAMLSTTSSYKGSSDDDIYLIKTNDLGTANCNTKFELVVHSVLSVKSVSFGSITSGFKSQAPSLTTTTISSSFDTTLCCKLVAEVSQDTFRICEGTSVSLGKAGLPGLTYQWTDNNGNKVSNLSNPSVKPTASITYKLKVSSDNGACAADSATVKVTVLTRLTYDFARDTSFCEKDSVTVTTRSNMAGYQWLGTHINSNAQSIKIKMADTIYFTGFDNNSCVYKDTMKVKVFGLPTVSLGKDTTICENTPITLKGPNNMASYNWNNGESSKQNFTTATEKQHTLSVVDKNGCMASGSRKIFTNPYSAFSLGSDAEFCEGGAFTILGPGALSNYVWNDTASTFQNLTVYEAGKYWLKAHNSFGCPYSDTIVLTTRNAPTFSLGPDFKLCIGFSRYLVGPTKMKRYAWASGSSNDSLKITTSGTYMLTVTDSFDCKFTDSIKVEDAPNPDITLGNDTVICIGDSLRLTPGLNFVTYNWSNGSTAKQIYVKDKGNYSVNIKDVNGCAGTADIDVDTMTCNSSFRELRLGNLKAYPNPVNQVLYLDFSSLENYRLNWTLSGLNGQELRKGTKDIYSGENHLMLDLGELSKGIYMLQLHNTSGMATLKVSVD